MSSRYTLLGIVDDVTACDCCGKVDLKCTMALSELDSDGNEVGVVYFGRDCGARALGWKVSADMAEKLARGQVRLSKDALYKAWTSKERSEDIKIANHWWRGFRYTHKGVDLQVIVCWPRNQPRPDGWHPYFNWLWRVAA